MPYVRASIFTIQSIFFFLISLLFVQTVVASVPGIEFHFPRLGLALTLVVPISFALAGPLVLVRPSRRLAERISNWLDLCTFQIDEWMTELNADSRSAWIGGAAGASIFFELLLIRWEGSLFPVFALYKNFVLLACFCGLGIGYALGRQRPLVLPLCLPLLFVLIATLSSLHSWPSDTVNQLLQVVPVREEGSVMFAFSPTMPVATLVSYSLLIYAVLAGTFAVNALVLLPVGQFCGRLMEGAPARLAYGYNLLGSIMGTVLMFLLSWFWTGPVVWFAIICGGLSFAQLPSISARGFALSLASACVLTASWPVAPLDQVIFSPYQVLETTTQPNGMLMVLASGSYYQKIYDLSSSGLNRYLDSETRKIVGYYDLPFKTAHALSSIAIVGAGTGNDAAAALRNNAESVDAVEIDPAVRDLGLYNHPERPYQNSRVHSVINDARNFFRATNRSYDLIVYGVLDSHVVLSHGANVRVDSYVYTQEGLREAFAHLRPGGLMSLAFALPTPDIGIKVFRMLSALPDAGPVVAVLTGYDNNLTTTFMVAKGSTIKLPTTFMAQHDLTNVTPLYSTSTQSTPDLPSDDWPFLYMAGKIYPSTYVISLGLILTVGFLLSRTLVPGQAWLPSMLPYFFLGGGFMLLETKTISELALLFGNTWQVTGLTVVSVLIMAYLANLLSVKFSRANSTRVFFAGLSVTLALGYFVAVVGHLNAANLIERFLFVGILSSPLFFSGLLFSTLIKSETNIAVAMGYNIIGAMLGGALEYNSMRFGFSSLYLFAGALYAMAWMSTAKFRTASRSALPD